MNQSKGREATPAEAANDILQKHYQKLPSGIYMDWYNFVVAHKVFYHVIVAAMEKYAGQHQREQPPAPQAELLVALTNLYLLYR